MRSRHEFYDPDLIEVIVVIWYIRYLNTTDFDVTVIYIKIYYLVFLYEKMLIVFFVINVPVYYVSCDKPTHCHVSVKNIVYFVITLTFLYLFIKDVSYKMLIKQVFFYVTVNFSDSCRSVALYKLRLGSIILGNKTSVYFSTKILGNGS